MELAGTGTSDLTVQQVLDAGQVLAGLPDGQIARSLAGLPGPERWQAESWVLQVRTVVPQVALAGRYLAGELVELTGTQLRSMIAGLAPSVAGQTALDLLAAADDEQLGEIFADWPGMLALLEAAFPAGDGRRGQLEGILAGRFGGVPRGQPARAFTPALISAELAALGPGELKNVRQLNLVAGVLGPLADEAVLAGLTGLSQVQWQRARRWLRGARQAIADMAEARDHLSGERRVPDERLAELSASLAQGQVRWAALGLVQAASDTELGVIFAGNPGLAGMLEAAIPAGHRLGASLEAFVLNRAGSYWLAGSSGQSARWVGRAQRYRSGAPDQDLTAQQLRTLAEILLSGTPGQAETEAALALLAEADDDQLSVMLDGRGLLDLLDAAAEVTPGLEERVNEFLGRWFAGGGRPQGQPAAAFSPALLDPSLPDDAVTGQLDDELAQRVADVLARRSDAQVRAALAGLPLAQQRRGEWFIGAARARAGWSGQVDRHLSGDPAAELTGGTQRDLAVRLLTGGAATSERQAALRLLDAASDDDLGAIFAGGGGLLEVLEEGIPPGHELRGELDQFLVAALQRRPAGAG